MLLRLCGVRSVMKEDHDNGTVGGRRYVSMVNRQQSIQSDVVVRPFDNLIKFLWYL